MEVRKTLPDNTKSLEDAARSFVEDSHAQRIDKEGLYKQTLENMVSATALQMPGRFLWIHEVENIVKIYALSHLSKDVDDALCYTITQCWVHKDLRGKKETKAFWELFRAHAKSLLCRHILIPSSRNTKAYCRLLGHGMHEYVTLLKEDLI